LNGLQALQVAISELIVLSTFVVTSQVATTRSIGRLYV
jgi:hypothetical protein